MMHKTCPINYGHLADLQKALPTIDLNKKKQLSFDKISPRDFYVCPFFSICTCQLIDLDNGLALNWQQALQIFGNVSMANKIKLCNINCLAPEGKKPREDVVKQL